MSGFVYIWRDKKHNRYYIGCHWGKEDDNYICSSPWMLRAYKRRPEDFKRRILKNGISSREELLDEEYRWISLIKEEEIKVCYYNLHVHPKSHWISDEEKAATISLKMSLSRRNKKYTETHKKNISKGMEGHICKEETREKIRQSKLGKKRLPLSDQWKERISKVLTGKKYKKRNK